MPGDVLRTAAEKGLVISMIPYIHDTTVVACIIKLLTTKHPDGGQRAVYERLLEDGFWREVARVIAGDAQDTEACCEFVLRLAAELNGEEPAEMLWSALVATPDVIDSCIRVLSNPGTYDESQLQHAADLVQGLVVGSTKVMQNGPMEGPVAAVPATPPPNRMAGMVTRLCELLCPHVPVLAARLLGASQRPEVKLSGRVVVARFGALRFALLDTISQLALTAPGATLPMIPDDLWLALVGWCLDYRDNTMYQARFQRLFKVVIQQDDARALTVMVTRGRLIDVLVEHYDSGAQTGLRSLALLLLNLLRLKADTQRGGPSSIRDLLDGSDAYQRFLPALREETSRQARRHVTLRPLPAIGLNGLPTHPALIACAAASAAALANIGAGGIDLGSDYARMLDFTDPPWTGPDAAIAAAAAAAAAAASIDEEVPVDAVAAPSDAADTAPPTDVSTPADEAPPTDVSTPVDVSTPADASTPADGQAHNTCPADAAVAVEGERAVESAPVPDAPVCEPGAAQPGDAHSPQHSTRQHSPQHSPHRSGEDEASGDVSPSEGGSPSGASSRSRLRASPLRVTIPFGAADTGLPDDAADGKVAHDANGAAAGGSADHAGAAAAADAAHPTENKRRSLNRIDTPRPSSVAFIPFAFPVENVTNGVAALEVTPGEPGGLLGASEANVEENSVDESNLKAAADATVEAGATVEATGKDVVVANGAPSPPHGREEPT